MTTFKADEIILNGVSLDTRLKKLESILGDWDTPPKLSEGKTPTPLPNGRYDLKEADYQIRMELGNIVGYQGKDGFVEGHIQKIKKEIGVIKDTKYIVGSSNEEEVLSGGFTPPEQRKELAPAVMPERLMDEKDLYINRLKVNELYIGNAIKLTRGQGTHYRDGRLSIQGVGKNGIEIELIPGPECNTGIACQIMWFWHMLKDSFARFSITARKQSDGSSMLSIGSDSRLRPTPPMEFLTGGRTFDDGSDNGGRLLYLVFESGQVDKVEPNGSRVTVRKSGGIPADRI